MKVYAVTDAGRVRATNEDSVCIPNRGEHFCAVADGMGGHNAGEVASSMAVERFSETMRAMGRCTAQTLRMAVSRANGAVYDASLQDAARRGMGTTFSALLETHDDVHIAHVGDSRIYRIRRDVIVRVTTDHTLVEMMVLNGEITPSQAKVHPKRNLITRALGVDRDVDIDMLCLDRRARDIYLLCTDGFSNHVDESVMLEVTKGAGTWEEKLRTLLKLALDAGSTDNVTVMYAVLEEAPGR